MRTTFVVDVETARESPMTTGGETKFSTVGSTGYTRRRSTAADSSRGYWWSPDSSRSAFLQIDETARRRVHVVDEIPYQHGRRRSGLPEGRRSESAARSWVSSAPPAAVQWVDTGRVPAARSFDRRRAWAPEGRSVVSGAEPRADLAGFEPGRRRATGSTNAVPRNQQGVGRASRAARVWLADGSFLWLSERSGWRHLYHYSADGTLVRQVTRRRVGSADAARRRRSGEAGSISPAPSAARSGSDVYRIRLDGSGLERLSKARRHAHGRIQSGVRATTSTSGATSTTPPQVRLHANDGTRGARHRRERRSRRSASTDCRSRSSSR